MNNPIYLTDQELLKGIALMRQNALALEKLCLSRGNNEGLTPQDHAILRTIFLHPKQRAGEIARKMRLRKQALSRRLKFLLDQGFILEEIDPDDRRAKLLCLSTKGLEYYTVQQDKALRVFYHAYQKAGISAVEGFHQVQQALSQALE